ncbi:MAG TPA: hypothetical protein VGN14_01705 [Candidatus Elarobacter sp.]|jgi:streptogramin lyase
MNRLALGGLLAVGAFALNACGGAGRNSAALPATASSPSPGKAASATLRITIPAKASTAAAKRSPRYISPATESVAISFVPTSGPTQTFNQNLTTASNPNCTASLVSPTICTITLALMPGSYTATFVTYDGLLDGGGNPTGSALSANQNIPVTIVAGQANTVDVAFQGIPTSVAFLPNTTSTLRGSPQVGFNLAVCDPAQSVTVVGVDADGNYILGPGAPVPSLVSSNAALVSVTAPTTGAPNTFVLNPQAGATAGQQVALTATATPSASAPNDSGAAAVSTIVAINYDQYVCRTYTELPNSVQNPFGITVGPDSAIWAADNGDGSIGNGLILRTTTAGAFSTYAALIAPYGITSGPDGKLWYTDPINDEVGSMTTTGTAAAYSLASGSQPYGITAGPDGNIWFAESVRRNIANISPTTHAITEYSDPTGGYPIGIAAGPDGYLWFTSGDSAIGRMSTGGAVTVFTLAPNSFPAAIAAGPDGAMWFVESLGNRVGRITTDSTHTITEFAIPTADANPYGITAGTDGAMWFTESYANKIGRIALNASPSRPNITEYPVGGNPRFIVTGPDNAEYFTEGASKIGRLK